MTNLDSILKRSNWLCKYLWNCPLLVQSLNCVRLFATPWTAACQASLPFTIFWSLSKLMSTESVMPSTHLILCCPLFLLPSIFPSIRVFFNESALHIRWPEYWSFSFNISLSDEYSGLISFQIDWFGLLEIQGILKNFPLLLLLLLSHFSLVWLFGTPWTVA